MRGVLETGWIAYSRQAGGRYLRSPLLDGLGLPHLFTTRHFPGVASWGQSAPPLDPVALALLAELGIAKGPPAYLRQVHGADVLRPERAGLVGRADILASQRAGLPLAVFTADCLPIVLYDPECRSVAVAHAGWRGTALGAARAAVRALAAGGGRPETFAAAIGPSIGPCCYEVDEPVIARLEDGFPGQWERWVTATVPGKWMLDLWRANADQLVMDGMAAARIDNGQLCTSCRGDLFYSYRRGRGEGRLVAVAAVPADVTPRRAAGSR